MFLPQILPSIFPVFQIQVPPDLFELCHGLSFFATAHLPGYGNIGLCLSALVSNLIMTNTSQMPERYILETDGIVMPERYIIEADGIE